MEQQGYEKSPGQTQQPFHGKGRDLPIVGHSDWRRELRKTILSRVVPRLSEIGKDADMASAPHPAPTLTAEQVVHFAELVLAAAVPGLIQYIDELRSEGLSIEAVVLQLMAPAARRLGDLWLEDRLSFLDVTAGLGRLQGVMRALGPDFDGDTPGLIHGKKILLAPVAGEQHIFGLSVVAAFFRRAGWDVTFEPRIAFDDLLILVRAERFTAIGLSVGNDKFMDLLGRQIEALRGASLNRAVTLLARSNYSVSEIAALCGFASPFHFSRCFKDAYGVPPRELRLRIEAGEAPPTSRLLRTIPSFRSISGME